MTAVPPPAASGDETTLVEALRDGSEAAFGALVDRHHRTMLWVARRYVADAAAAEDVVQETWLAVLRGLNRFDGRSSLRTWIFRILTNRAKTAGQRAARVVPVTALAGEGGASEPAVAAERFLDHGHADWPGHWRRPPAAWPVGPEERVVDGEAVAVVRCAVGDLPPGQRDVMTLRDLQGWTAAEVCNVLGLTETNQRVLLHRARSKVRQRLERYFEEAAEP